MQEKQAALIAELAKQAALFTSSHSKRMKLRGKRDQKNAGKALKAATGNSHSPHRYGRKVR